MPECVRQFVGWIEDRKDQKDHTVDAAATGELPSAATQRRESARKNMRDTIVPIDRASILIM